MVINNNITTHTTLSVSQDKKLIVDFKKTCKIQIVVKYKNFTETILLTSLKTNTNGQPI